MVGVEPRAKIALATLVAQCARTMQCIPGHWLRQMQCNVGMSYSAVAPDVAQRANKPAPLVHRHRCKRTCSLSALSPICSPGARVTKHPIGYALLLAFLRIARTSLVAHETLAEAERSVKQVGDAIARLHETDWGQEASIGEPCGESKEKWSCSVI